MNFKVEIAARAERNLDEIITYLTNEWSVKVKDRYLFILTEKLNLISQNPSLYPVSIKSETFADVLSLSIQLYIIGFKKQQIEIVTIVAEIPKN